MHITTLLFAAAIAVAPMQQQEESKPPTFDFDKAITEVAARIVAEDLGLQVVQRPPQTAAEQAEIEAQPGFFQMMGESGRHAPELVFMAASVADMWSKQELQKVCASNEFVSCDAGWPQSVTMDAAITAGVYAGVVGVQRLAQKYWGVDLDDGWKELLLWGGLSLVRGFFTWEQVQDANAVRGFGQ